MVGTDFSLKNKETWDQTYVGNPVCWITGASSGIGRALASEYARRGYNLILSARRQEILDQVIQEAQAQNPGVKVLGQTTDVTQAHECEAALQLGLKEFKRLDVVIANAGFGVTGNLEDLTTQDYQRQFDTNIFGVINTIQPCLQALKDSKGRIGIIGSLNSFVPVGGVSPYCMSKFAVRALNHCLNQELGGTGVSSTLIAPGYVDTEIFKVDNLGQHHPDSEGRAPQRLAMSPKRCATLIYRALRWRQQVRFITIHARLIYVMYSLAPGLLTFALKKFRTVRLQSRNIKTSVAN